MRGEHVLSTDEKTGIQALERIAPTKPPRPGLIERIEGEYKRHGTLCLTADFEVATGEVVSYTIAPTRTELEFAEHLERAISDDPLARWTFVADNLNTHLSATLVELVAGWCDITDDLGEKGKSGILKNKASRAAFLADKSHRIRLVYTPKHCSWLNQVEMWSFRPSSRARPPAIEAFQLRFPQRPARAHREVHRLLQRRVGSAIPVDVHGASSGGVRHASDLSCLCALLRPAPKIDSGEL